jgi:hypothetical protein
MGELMQSDEYSMTHETLSSKKLKASILNTLSSDPHLTDLQLIEFSSGVTDPESTAVYYQHVQGCMSCEAEAALLIGHLAVWQVPSEIERLEARIGRPEVMAGRSAKPWWEQVANWVSVAPLRVTGAHAAGLDFEVINFPVHGESEIAHGLSGIIQRRGQEFQIKITPSTEQTVSYKDRMVEVVLVESGTEDVLLQRNIPINRFVLLGTDLPIRTERIAAKLIT